MSRRRALLIGLNYSSVPSAALAGCVNDVKNMQQCLTTLCGFSSAQIETVTDDVAANLSRLTRDGILSLLFGLCVASWREALDMAVFHFSGHGSQALDRSGDEKDGRDEGIVPLDFQTRGLLLDDTLTSILAQFNPRTKVVCFFDCCHSGTVLDLPFAYDSKALSDNGVRATKAGPPGPRIYCISGCLDPQVSMDAADPVTREPAGAMTNCALKLLTDRGRAAYPVLDFQDDLNKLLRLRGFEQRPLLTASLPIRTVDSLF